MKSTMAGLALLLAGSVALAGAMAPLSVPMQVAAADAVFVGKVTAVADKAVPADFFKGDTRMMKLATVAVGEGFLGGVGKNVEVGFFPTIGKRAGVSLARGNEALFFVRRHPTRKATYVADSFYSAVRAGGPEFKGYVAEAKMLSGILADPKKALAARDKGARARAAGLLVLRYRTTPPGASPKTEAVPAAESRLILEALAEADWKDDGRGFGPASAFSWLNPTATDGWTPPKDFNLFADEARKWLAANAGKYRMKRFVRPESGPAVEP